MTEEKNRGVPTSTQVSAFDLQLSACAIEGHQDDGTQSQERRRDERRRAQASVPSNTVRLAVGQLIGGRYRIERELGEGGMGVVYPAADETRTLNGLLRVRSVRRALQKRGKTLLTASL